MYICFCFSFLSHVLTRRGLVTTVSWKIRGLSAKRARSICSVLLLAGAVKEDYGAGSKMGNVTCIHVLPGVESKGSPERMLPPRGTNARTGGPALIGPADRSLNSSACCGTDAGAATAAMQEDRRSQQRSG
jgi:hypothetical protein